MSVQITDCTIRDGGYLLEKNSSPDFVKGIIKGLLDAGIDFIETGFLQDNVNGETIVYRNSKDVIKYFPSGVDNAHLLGFCDNSRYSAKNLDPYDGTSFRWIRISFAKHECEPALAFCEQIKEKGYLVQFNPMDAISYSPEEWEKLLHGVNWVRPESFSIVDTFGAMYLDDLADIFKRTNSNLDKGIKVGLHSHDNLGLSCALAETLITLADASERDVIVDGSLFGMGRGAGNAPTELLAGYINSKHGGKYNIPALLDLIDKYIVPLREKIHWGYDLPMFICGIEHSHVDNMYYLQKNTDCSPSEMYAIIRGMSAQHRTRYGSNYSKSDFSVLQETYERTRGGKK